MDQTLREYFLNSPKACNWGRHLLAANQLGCCSVVGQPFQNLILHGVLFSMGAVIEV